MATLSHSESRRLYSWWWNSHISPKNSKWLQENLADMDSKVKAMIRIIEEDADSFAKRAEMYYKKRPELMKLVEEFYRAYRSLAERYDNATGVLRQAHQTMAVVFPNQIPLEISDESPSGFSSADVEPINSEMLIELFNADDGSRLDASSVPSLYDAMKMSGAISEEIDADFAEGSMTKRLNFREEDGKDSVLKLLREEISRLSKENLDFKNQITLASDRANKAETEVRQIKDSFSKEQSEKEDAICRYNESMTKASCLETEISCIQEELKKLNDEMLMESESLTSAKERSLLLEQANQSLELELDMLKKRTKEQQEELDMKGEELAKLEISLQDEHLKNVKNEMACRSLEKQYAESQEETRGLLEKLKEMELTKLSLEEELQKISEENNRLNEQKLSSTLKIIKLQDEIIFLRDLKGKLEDELNLCREEKELLHQELCQLKEDRNIIEERHHALKEQIQEVTLEKESLQAIMKELRDGNKDLKETIKKHGYEKVIYLQNLEHFEKKYSESQEEVRGVHEKLKEMELTKFNLEEELQKIREENNRLDEHKLSSTIKIINLQDEIIFLKNFKGKLEDQLELSRGEKEVLHLDFCQLKEDKNNLEERHHVLKDQIRAVTLETESLRVTIKELTDGNNDLKETIKKNEHEKVLYLQNLEWFEKQYSESQEEVRGVHEKLKKMELTKLSLEEELQKIREQNNRLNDEKLSSTVKIINLQDEIISLKNLKWKLEDELELRIGEKEILHLELCQLKEDTNNSEQRHNLLKEQIQAITLEMESLQAMIKELKDGNDDLIETIKKHEYENVLYLQNIRNIQTTSERNAILETSLSDANIELERLRVKIKILEDSRENLHSRISVDQAEKTVLISHMDTAAQNIEKLLNKNTFLENTLSDVNFELDSLKEKLKTLDASCRSLQDQKSILLTENNTLVSQVESISWDFRNLENSYTELEGKCSNLEREKTSVLHQVAELQELLKLEKEKHKALIHSSKNQLSKLEDQIYHLETQCRKREEELEVEQHRIMNAQIEIFILQRCLCDIKEENLSHAVGFQKHQERLRSAEKLIVGLEQECLIKEKKMLSLAEHNEKLREWILGIIKLLEIDQKYVSLDDVKDEFLLQLILCEVRHLLNSISEAHDEKQILTLEKSVVVTLLEQFGLYVADLRAEVMDLDRESKIRAQEFALLEGKNDEILEMNKQLREKVHDGNQREELLKAEVDVLFSQLSQLQEAHRKLQIETSKMSEENQVLSKKLHELMKKKDKLEGENNVLLAENMALDYLSVALRSSNAERGLELQLLSDERDSYCNARDDLVQEITLMSKKVEVLKLENKHLKASFTSLEECRRFLLRLENDLNTARNIINVCEQLNLQTHTGKSLLLEEDIELSQAKNNLQRSRVTTNPEFYRNLEDLKMDADEAKVVREVMEKKISTLSEDYDCKRNELACIHQVNETTKLEIARMKNDIDKFRIKEDNLTTELQKGTDEIKSSEMEILSLLNEIQCATISATLFREKVIELILTCESIERSTLLHRKVLHEEIMLRDVTINELKEKVNALEGENRILKEELNAYLSLLGTFWDDIAILEEQTLSLGKYHPSPNNQVEQDNQVRHVRERSQEVSQTSSARSPPGILELQSLQAKVRALQKLVRETRSLLELERLDSNVSLEAACREIEALRSKDNSDNDSRKMKYERIMRDIKLDIVLNSSRYWNNIRSHGARKRGNANETSDQNIELQGTTEGDCSNQKQKSPLAICAAHHQIQEVEENHPSSELVSEKELGVDKLEVHKKAESLQEWNKRVMERLCSDAQRLLVLQASTQELHKNLEALEKISNQTAFDLDTAKVQLKEAEGTISKLVDINSKLTKKAEGFSESSNQVGEKKDIGNRCSRRQISDRAEKVSEKIGVLELELQKVQYTVQEIEEELKNKKTRVVEKSGVLLKEYIYGKRDRRKKKKGSCCMRPKAKGD